ncbi:pentapeptide repeat-containing protein [Extibacter muris]|uniref:pentapeptide repeat-containing protein n=1 Tax=Extibacter muris TaxID=1796622 RepID=UPI0021C81E8D|nr:pentapeptide repeat-containing protein [Extibacter muris]MCU0079315.1 pentapeptide repeat-containing protein [Extibacter muris]
MFEIGDLVRGTKESDGQYEITNSAMTKGIVVDIGPRGNILVRVLQHQCGVHGMHCVKPEYFEKIGHAEPFEAAKFQEALSKGKDKAVEYLLSADLSYADLRHASLNDADLSYADLSGANLRGANLSDTDLSGANLRGANLSDTDLSGADLRHANMSYADLSGANLSDADLSGANLRGANLSGANLRGADLRHANLRHANLSGADLDFSCFPLWCGGMNIKSDVRIARQLAYHFCRLDCENEEYIDARNALVQFANGFHRVQECGQLAFRSKSQKVK